MNYAEIQKQLELDNEGQLSFDATLFMGKDSDFERNFTDPFNNEGPWPLGDFPAYRAKMEDGHYYFEHKDNENAFYSYVPMSILAHKNWAIETKIEALDLPSGNSIGLLIGRNMESEAGSTFFIDSNSKKIWVAHHNGKDWFIPLNGRNCSILDSKVNTLRVENLNGYWQFYINSRLVYISESQALYGNAFGFAFNGKAAIRADYFKIQW